jgi:transglutaminase-like putative cysteine protease
MSMATRYRVTHRTRYVYASEVVHAHQALHLTPRSLAHQSFSDHRVTLVPTPTHSQNGTDAFGNAITRMEFDWPHFELDVLAEMTVTVHAAAYAGFASSQPWERVRDDLAYRSRPRTAEELEAVRYRVQSPYVQLKNVFVDFAHDCFAPGTPIALCALALSNKLHRTLTYTPGGTTIDTPLLQILAERRGVCQDYAHLMIACLRARGLAARYVSGYLRTTRVADAPQLVGADASHAWVSVYVPPLGWIDLDPTNGLIVGKDHITLAWGRDFGDVSPLRGVIVGGGSHTLEVSVNVAEQLPANDTI